MAESSKSHELDYAIASKTANMRRLVKIVLCGLTFFISLFIIFDQPAWFYEHRDSATTYRVGIFGRSFGFSRSTEEVPMGPLPPPAKLEFINFIYMNGVMQSESLRVTGMAITHQWRVTNLGIPVWLPMLISFIILVLAFKPRRLVSVFTKVLTR